MISFRLFLCVMIRNDFIIAYILYLVLFFVFLEEITSNIQLPEIPLITLRLSLNLFLQIEELFKNLE